MASSPLATGENITVLRKAAGLTQRQMAARANISLSMLSKVEIGDRAAGHALVAAVARALGVPIERVHGQPYEAEHRAAGTTAAIDALRGALRGYDLPPAAQIDARPLDQLRVDVGQLSQMRRAGRYTKLATTLPATMEELTLLIHTTDGATEREQAFRLLVDAFYAAHGLAYRLGYGDLAESIEHKLAWAADHSGDPLAIGLAQWTRANSFQAAGDYDRGLQLLDTAREHLNSYLATGDPAAITVYGSMHLRAATLASRAGNADTTEAHLRAARELAARIRHDQVHYQLTFGPANTAIHDIAAAVELGNAEHAVTVGTALKTPRGLPATRVGHHYLDLARAHLMLGDRPGTLTALENARRAAPEQTRYHPMVRETARVLVSLHRRANPDLTRFATWLGLAN
ncbi:helix-turn-helix domain-containing protein [Actinokineospora sp.]|uniref:helix-turn-helix domain-containing protein n=1 Tax=Actinokineospora sp. TaxID=1872133 RepID=UPI00403765C3